MQPSYDTSIIALRRDFFHRIQVACREKHVNFRLHDGKDNRLQRFYTLLQRRSALLLLRSLIVDLLHMLGSQKANIVLLGPLDAPLERSIEEDSRYLDHCHTGFPCELHFGINAVRCI